MHAPSKTQANSLSFFVDESSGGKLAKALREYGLDVQFVSDIMPGVTDEEVLTYAEKTKRILITNDKDFGELIFRLHKPSSGVILLRLKIDTPERREKAVRKLIELFAHQLPSHFVVVMEGRVRIRKI